MAHVCNAFCRDEAHCTPVWQEPIDGVEDPETYAELIADRLERYARVRVLEVRSAPELPSCREYAELTGQPMEVIAGDHLIEDGYRFLAWWRWI